MQAPPTCCHPGEWEAANWCRSWPGIGRWHPTAATVTRCPLAPRKGKSPKQEARGSSCVGSFLPSACVPTLLYQESPCPPTSTKSSSSTLPIHFLTLAGPPFPLRATSALHKPEAFSWKKASRRSRPWWHTALIQHSGGRGGQIRASRSCLENNK